MIRTSLFSLSIALLGAPVLAGNLEAPIVEAPVAIPAPVIPASSWTGFYVGGDYSIGEAANLGDDYEYDALGLNAGYLHDLGSFVVGGEVSYSEGQVDVSGTDLDVDLFRAKAIVGYDLGRFLPYVAAGISNVDVEGFDDDTTEFVGIGGTYALTDEWRVGAEYLFDSSDDFNNSGEDADLDALSVRASFAF
jgi:opacity protein-like surface antigen